MEKKTGVRYGVRNVYLAWFDEAEDKFETPVALPGCRALKTSPEGDTKKWYADDTVYFIGRANNGYSGELELAKFALKIMADAQGWTYDEATGVLYEIGGNVVVKPFALLFEVEGDLINTRFCYYNCTLDRPEHEWGTTEDEVEPTTEKCGISIDPYMIGETPYIKAMCELSATNASTFDNWFKSVNLPTATNSVAG